MSIHGNWRRAGNMEGIRIACQVSKKTDSGVGFSFVVNSRTLTGVHTPKQIRFWIHWDMWKDRQIEISRTQQTFARSRVWGYAVSPSFFGVRSPVAPPASQLCSRRTFILSNWSLLRRSEPARWKVVYGLAYSRGLRLRQREVHVISRKDTRRVSCMGTVCH